MQATQGDAAETYRYPRPLPPGSGMRVDWLVVTVVTAAVAAVAALAVSLMVLARVRQDSERNRTTTALAAVWRFADEWGGDDMVAARSGAATALLADRTDEYDVDEVLHFFDEIAFVWSRGAVDDELLWYHFYWPMVSYWAAAQVHVSRARAQDPTLWVPLEGLIKRLMAVEAEHRDRSAAPPTREQVRDFLTREMDSGACTEGQETATPRGAI
jgi:hypothetical protein